jgi:hypothetical protein
MNGCFQETKVVKYFMEKQGLRGTSHDVKTLGETDVLKEMCKVFCQKNDKNGWKFKLYIDIAT